jgi:hypothetical protein
MKNTILIFALLALLLVTACRAASNLAGTENNVNTANDNNGVIVNRTQTVTGEFNYIFNESQDAFSISVTLDPTQSVEGVIPVEGGILTAKGADGTVYTLDIPGDALLTETKIKMTPVGNVTGLPFGGEQTYAVQFEPEGLNFNNFVILTIAPAQEIPLDQQITFGYQGEGKGLVLAPPVVDSNEIKIQMLHFSGSGVTKGLLADTEPVRQRLGGDTEARIQSLVAEQLSRERQRQLLGTGDAEGSTIDFEDLFKQYEEQVVKPRLAAAGESCAAGRLALQTVLGLERQRQLLGASDENGTFSQQIADLMKTVAKVCIQEEYELCVDEHIIHRMIPVWLGMERQYQLLGLADEGAQPEELKLAKDLTQKCLTFELQFESDGNFDDGEGGGYESVVKSKVKLQFNPDEFKIKGQSALINDSFEFRVPGCSVTSNRGGSTFDGISLTYDTDTHSPTDELGYVRDFKLIYWPGTTSENFTVTCPDDPPYTSPPTGLWSGLYLVLHFDEVDQGNGAGLETPPMPDMSATMDGPGIGAPVFAMPQMAAGGGYVASDWEMQSGDYLAKKEWIKEDAGLGLTEAGTLKLYHRPGN